MGELWTGATVEAATELVARLGLTGDRAVVPIGAGSPGERPALAVLVDVEGRAPVEVWRPLAEACRDEPLVPVLTTVVRHDLAGIALACDTGEDPAGVVDAALAWAAADFDEAMDDHVAYYWSEAEPGDVEPELEATRNLLGIAPAPSEVPEGLSLVGLERWLYEWEDAHGAEPQPSHVTYQPYYPMAVVFLPIAASWQVAAVQGQFDIDPTEVAAWLHRWHGTHGAEVVVMDGIYIHLAVARPAVDGDEAWSLALQHDRLGPGAFHIRGFPLRWAARSLRAADTWTMCSMP